MANLAGDLPVLTVDYLANPKHGSIYDHCGPKSELSRTRTFFIRVRAILGPGPVNFAIFLPKVYTT